MIILLNEIKWSHSNNKEKCFQNVEPYWKRFLSHKQPPEVFCKKVFLKISQNSQENTLAEVFFCEFCEIFKNIYFYRTSLVPASERLPPQKQICRTEEVHSVLLITITHFSSMFHFSTPWKLYKTFGFVTFSGGRKMEHWT